jgi:hypothetical protein
MVIIAASKLVLIEGTDRLAGEVYERFELNWKPCGRAEQAVESL